MADHTSGSFATANRMGWGRSRTVTSGNTSASFATAGRAAGEPMLIPTGEDTSANGGMGISMAVEFRTYPDGRKEDGEWSGGKFVRSAEENSPLSDTSENAPGGDCRCKRNQPVNARRFDWKRDFWRRRAASDGVSRLWSCHRGGFRSEGRIRPHQLPPEVKLTKPKSNRKLSRLGARYSKPSRISACPMLSCWNCAQSRGGFRGTHELGKQCGSQAPCELPEALASKFQTGEDIRSDRRIIAEQLKPIVVIFRSGLSFPFTANFDVIHDFSCHFLRDGGKKNAAMECRNFTPRTN